MLVGEGANKRGALNEFLENFQKPAKYLLFENKEKCSCCLVYASLSHIRTKNIEKTLRNR